MRKLWISRIVRGAMVAVTLAAIVIVFFRNLYPPLDDMIVLDNISNDNSMVKSGVLSAAMSGSSGNSEGNSGGSGSYSGGSAGSLNYTSGNSEVNSGFVSIDEPVNGKININTASVSELMTLSGIGEARAKAIVEYRDTYGGFSSVDDLVLVDGIGEKTLEKNRDLITV